MAATAVTTDPPSGITSTAATLEGVVNPDGTQGRAYFEYGPTVGYGFTTAQVDVGDGVDPVDVAKRVSSFSPLTTYHYRVVLDTDVVPPSSFGAILAADYPRIGTSGGSTTHVDTKAELLAALSSVANDDIISVDSDIVGAGEELNLTRVAAAGAPITITGSGALRGFQQVRVSGSYLRLLNLTVHDNSEANIKVSGRNIEIDGCEIYNSGRQGILVVSPAFAVQIWNCKIYDNGSTSHGNLDHGIYFSYARGQNVIANNLCYHNCAYNIQVYPDSPGVVLSCNTLDDGIVHAQSRGGMIVGSNPGSPLTINTINVGLLTTRAAQYGVALYNPGPGNNTYDVIGFDNGISDFQTGSGMTYTHQSHADPLFTDWDARIYTLEPGSPAIDYILEARYGYVTTTYRDGSARLTADCGSEPQA